MWCHRTKEAEVGGLLEVPTGKESADIWKDRLEVRCCTVLVQYSSTAQ